MLGVVVLAFAYVLSQFFRSFLGVLSFDLIQDIGIDETQLAIASGSWFLTFALMQFVVGVSLDRFGPRRTTATMLGFMGAGGALMFAFAQTPWMIIVAMGMIGIGCAPILMASFFIFARIFKPSFFAMLASWFMAFGMLGIIFSSSPIAYGATTFGWRNVMISISVATALIAVLIFFVVRDPEIEDEGKNSGFRGYFELLKLKVLWPIIPILMMCPVATVSIRGIWASPFFHSVYQLDQLEIGSILLYMSFMIVISSIIIGPLDKLFNTRKYIILPIALMTFSTLFYLAFWAPVSLSSAQYSLYFLGLLSGVYGITSAHARAFFPKHLIGRGVTLMNFFNIGGTAVIQMITGQIFAVSQAITPENAQAPYSSLWWFFVGILGVSIVIYLFSRDAKPES